MRVTPDDLASCRVAIAGLGLMGGSLALALSGKCAELLAVDTDPMVVVKALQQHVVDQASTDAAEILPHADLIVLATPILTIIDLLEQLPVFCPEQTMVIDFGSTKSAIVHKMQELPEYFDPIGGHPMCGKELGGLSNADATLFRHAAFALVLLRRSSQHVRNIAEQLVQAVGARLLYLDPETHDQWVAATSHLPYLVANALAAVTPYQAAPLVGPGLRSTTRLAPTPWSVMGDILKTNRENVKATLSLFLSQMKDIENLLASDDIDLLQEMLEYGADRYNQMIRIQN